MQSPVDRRASPRPQPRLPHTRKMDAACVGMHVRLAENGTEARPTGTLTSITV